MTERRRGPAPSHWLGAGRERWVHQVKVNQIAAIHVNDTSAAENPLLAAALACARRGWRVFPLHMPREKDACSCNKPDCHSVGKHPRTPKGVKDATTDAEQIRCWWSMWPDANIG